MSSIIKGKAFVLGDDIDTDQIIPAEYLVYRPDDAEESKNYGRYALSGVPSAKSGLPAGNIPFVAEEGCESDYRIIVAGKNFGCGSSREHAPFALQKAGVQAVVATSYARIFYRNVIDGGFLTPFESKMDISIRIKTGDVVEIDFNQFKLFNRTTQEEYSLIPLGEVAAIVQAGGLFEYARINKMV